MGTKKNKTCTEDIEQFFIENKLVMKINKSSWIPDYMDVLRTKPWYDKFHHREITHDDIFYTKEEDIEYIGKMELEAGADITLVNKVFANIEIGCIEYFGEKIPKSLKISEKIKLKKKDFNTCIEMTTIVEGKFEVNKNFYLHNLKFNTCWENRIAITWDNLVKPCIYSDIVVGDLKKDPIEEILVKLEEKWKLTKDKVKKCKDCEFRYICVDCRVIAKKINNDLYDENPNCGYDPYSGKWVND